MNKYFCVFEDSNPDPNSIETSYTSLVKKNEPKFK